MKNAAYETFVVRIYRRDAGDPQRLSGTVENAEHGARESFGDIDSLIAILSGNAGNKGSRKRPIGRTPPFAGG